MPSFIIITLFFMSLLVSHTTYAKPPNTKERLGTPFTDNMVLQQKRVNPIWGWDAPGTEITVTIDGITAKAKAAPVTGKWYAQLPEMTAGGPHTIIIKGSSETTLKNVLIGEVWICGGQSNMAITMSQEKYVQGSVEAIAAADFPQIRFINSPAGSHDTLKEESKTEAWQVVTPETAPKLSAIAFFFAREVYQETGVPIGLLSISRHGTSIESWIPDEGYLGIPALKEIADQLDVLPRRNERGTMLVQDPTANYNGSMAPFVPFGVRGALWYQGEFNVSDGLIYQEKLKALILGWRTTWKNENMPFYIVELGPHLGGKSFKSLPTLWEAQRRTSMTVPNVGLIVNTDVGQPNVHPSNKHTVGHRLAIWALANEYGKKDLVYSGPLFKDSKIEGSKIRVRFDHVGSGLSTLDGQPVDWFSIAGQDGEFVPATAVIENNTIVVSSDQVTKPTTVRFGWDRAAMPNLSNKEGLPASPFTTEENPSPLLIDPVTNSKS